MVNGSLQCDYAEGRNQVKYTGEDTAYFEKLIEGKLEVTEVGTLMFKVSSTGKRHFVKKLGRLENAFMGMSDPMDVRKGVMGRVAREDKCNAYESAGSNMINGGECEVATFRVYDIKLEEENYELRRSSSSSSGEPADDG